jgi:adenylosuccinate lyase
MPDPYISPFTWRYGSEAMRDIWSERTKRLWWRRIWVALARVQSRFGAVTEAQAADLAAHQDEVNLTRSLEIEAELHHDLMAEVRAYAEQCDIGGGIIHAGATSMDVKDNATILQMQRALDVILQQLSELLAAFANQIRRWADTPCMGFTHLQPAEPTTIGYRLAGYAQDLLEDHRALTRLREELRGKGFKGAVGTSASYAMLLPDDVSPAAFERAVMDDLGLRTWLVANQTYPRRQDWAVLSALAGVGSAAYRFALDLRLLQNPTIGEWSEPFGSRQVGSSAMPFKRNPIRAEKIDSLARYLAQLPRVAWDNAAHSALERTLDDSANRRVILPDAFLAADEVLRGMIRLVSDLRVNERAVQRTLDTYGPFAAIEPLLMRLVQAGADRQAMHEALRDIAMQTWAEIEAGKENPLPELLAAAPEITAHLTPEQIHAALDAHTYVGDAPTRARTLAAHIQSHLETEAV